MWTNHFKNVGEFTEKDHEHSFTYRQTDDFWAVSNGLIHEIDVYDGIRFGVVKKTVAYVCTDEDDNGKPVLNKWQIKKHNIYPEMS